MNVSSNYYTAILEAGLAVEITKHKVPEILEAGFTRLLDALDEYDRKHYQTVPCTGNILCERQLRRHKVNCMGRTDSFDNYARSLTSC